MFRLLRRKVLPVSSGVLILANVGAVSGWEEMKLSVIWKVEKIMAKQSNGRG
jgi:hypothetical protein